MALTNRLGVVNWTLENDTITLQSSIANQKRVEEETGKGFFEFLADMEDPKGNPLMRMSELFHYLQLGTTYSVDEIYNCFFVDLTAYGDNFPELQNKFINHLMGNAESKIIADAQKGEEARGNG